MNNININNNIATLNMSLFSDILKHILHHKIISGNFNRHFRTLPFMLQTWLKMHLNYPPWLEKCLKFTCLKCLKMHFNYPRWLKKILKFTCQSKFSEFSRFSLRQIKFPEFSRFSRLLDTLYYEFMLIGQMLCYITPIFRKGPFL